MRGIKTLTLATLLAAGTIVALDMSVAHAQQLVTGSTNLTDPRLKAERTGQTDFRKPSDFGWARNPVTGAGKDANMLKAPGQDFTGNAAAIRAR
jgi:hypothetical protein